MKKVAFDPIDKNDEYINIVKRIFNECDFEILDFTSEIKKKKPDFDFAYLNWFENMPHKSVFRNFLSFIKRLFILYKMKVKNIKFIYVAHNLALHDKNGSFFANIIIKKCLKQCTIIAATVQAAKQQLGEKYGLSQKELDKTRLISIPNYEIDQLKLNTDIVKRSDKPAIAYFGLIRPYKNIELIIELARINQGIDFFVFGSAPTEYQAELNELASDLENIKFDFRFLPNEELHSSISACDAVILPYNKESMLNSGAIRLASNLGKTVILPVIGNCYELNSENYYFYDYQTDAEHFDKLKEVVDVLVNDLKTDKNILMKKGQACQQEHMQKYNYDKIKEYYTLIFKEMEQMK